MAAIENSVQPGFKLLADFLASEYLPATRPDIAASSLPGLKEIFRGVVVVLYCPCVKELFLFINLVFYFEFWVGG